MEVDLCNEAESAEIFAANGARYLTAMPWLMRVGETMPMVSVERVRTLIVDG